MFWHAFGMLWSALNFGAGHRLHHPIHVYWNVLWYILVMYMHILTGIEMQYVLIWILDLEAYIVISIVACIMYVCALSQCICDRK